MKKKTIATSVLAIAMCSCLAIGGTYALFTSESDVNIAVSSGKVDIKAYAQDLKTYSGAWNEVTGVYDSVLTTEAYSQAGEGYYFSNGGYAAISADENTVTLDRITPMDKVTFSIAIKNQSNVAIQYRAVIKVVEDDGLFDGLTIKYGDAQQVYGGATTFTHWKNLNVGSADIIVPVSIELPEEADNGYQEKSCTISYTVEAVQGNARVYNGEAYLIRQGHTTEMATIQDALNVAGTGDTVRVAHAGTYAPFTVNTDGVTVEGIIAADKYDSAVFKTTANKNVQVYANNVTLKNVWVEVGERQTGISNWQHKGAVDPYVNTNTGTVANDITLDGCYFDGNNHADRAFLYCGNKLTVKNSTFEEFNYCAFDSMDDNNTPEKIEIVGNTFKGLKLAYDIYAGAAYNGAEENIVIKNNVSDNGAIVRLWDYVQYDNPTGNVTAFNAEVTGNENISLYLTHFDHYAETPIDTDETGIVYQMEVAFPAAITGSYSVVNADGSEITTFGDHKTTRNHNGVVVYALRAGDYKLVSEAHTYRFTVTEHTAGVLGSGYTAANVYEVFADGFVMNMQGVYEVENANGLRAFAETVNSGTTFEGKTVKLAANINLNNEEWTPIGTETNYFKGTFDGNGKTISNLTVSGNNDYAGLFGYTDGGTFQNFTIDTATISGRDCVAAAVADMFRGTANKITVKNATINGGHFVAGITGYSYGNVTECSVSASTVTAVPYLVGASYDNGDKVGGIIGLSASGNLTGNTVSDVTVTAYRDLGGIAGHVGKDGADPVVTGNTVKNVTIIQDDRNGYLSNEITTFAAIVGREAFDVDESANTATNVTINRQVIVFTPAQLSAALNATYSVDTTIRLMNDITLSGEWGSHALNAANNATLIIDGNGKTIYGLTSNNYYNVTGFNSNGLVTGIGAGFSSVTFKNLTISRAALVNNGGSSAATGVFVGDTNTVNVTFDNCTVTGATINCYKWAGGFIGYAQDVNSVKKTITFTNCKVIDSVINTTDSSAGGLVGHSGTNLNISWCHIAGNTSIKCAENRAGDVAKAGYLVGTAAEGSVTIRANTITVDRSATLNTMGGTTYDRKKYIGRIVSGVTVSGV